MKSLSATIHQSLNAKGATLTGSSPSQRDPRRFRETGGAFFFASNASRLGPLKPTMGFHLHSCRQRWQGCSGNRVERPTSGQGAVGRDSRERPAPIMVGLVDGSEYETTEQVRGPHHGAAGNGMLNGGREASCPALLAIVGQGVRVPHASILYSNHKDIDLRW